MNAKRAREQRRETKRTLGHQLEAFADNQHQRLVNVEGEVKELAAEKAALNDRVIELEKRVHAAGLALNDLRQLRVLDQAHVERRLGNLESDRRVGFVARLKWLLVGA